MMGKEFVICHTIACSAGIILDLIIGDPKGIPHPVVLIGRLIRALEKKLLHTDAEERDAVKERKNGRIMCLIVCLLTVLVTAALLFGAYAVHVICGIVVEAVLTCYILAAKSLCAESMKVCNALEQDDLASARTELSMIVGRDTEKLDEQGILRAAVETVSENTSDGVIAPLLCLLVAGPVAGMLYKAVNTMDSMVGYKNERYLHFGRAAARLDDACNFIPSRLSALLLICSATLFRVFDRNFSSGSAYRIWKRDRKNHTSPNSAQTESACAGALRIRLGGDSTYAGVLVHKPTIGDDIRNVKTEDIKRANMLMFGSELLLMLLYGICTVVLLTACAV